MNMNEEAKAIRLQWMTEYGLTQDEMEQCLIDDPPISVEIEQKELEAVRNVREMDTSWLGDLMKEIYKENGLPEDSKLMVCISCRKPVQFDEEGNGYCDHFDERPKK